MNKLTKKLMRKIITNQGPRMIKNGKTKMILKRKLTPTRKEKKSKKQK